MFAEMQQYPLTECAQMAAENCLFGKWWTWCGTIIAFLQLWQWNHLQKFQLTVLPTYLLICGTHCIILFRTTVYCHVTVAAAAVVIVDSCLQLVLSRLVF